MTYLAMPGDGGGLLAPVEGSLADLVLAIPSLVTEEIPPCCVFDDVLTRGIRDFGVSGGCIWQPLQIDAAEYEELVDELQRRGRPGPGIDAGRPFDVPTAPDHVQTYEQWSDFLYTVRMGSQAPAWLRQTSELAGLSAEQRHEIWLRSLPVGDLYHAHLSALDPGWEERPDDDCPLPAPLAALLRRLGRCYAEWHERMGTDRLRLSGEREAVNREIEACFETHDLPRWPFGPRTTAPA